MIPAATIAKLATLGLSAEQAEEVAAMLRAVEDATKAEAGAALEARRASEASRTARYRERGGGNIPDEMRRAVYERDGYRCVYCGDDNHLQCDHDIPVSRGGGTSVENLVTACRVCNARKKDRDRKAFQRMSADVRGKQRTEQTSADKRDMVSLEVSPEDNNQTPILNPSVISRGEREPSLDWPRNGFEQFYAAYPRKKAKQDAEKAYRAVERRKDVTFAALMAGLARYLASDPDTQFVPYPATWLRAGQWTDEPDPAPRPSSRSPPDRLTQADHRLNAHHSLFGQDDERDHHEVEIIPPGAEPGYGRSDRPFHGPDAGDVGPGRVRDFGRLRAVG